MLRSVVLVRSYVSEELIASIIRVTIGVLGTTLAVTSNWSTLRRHVFLSLFTANVVPSSPIHITLVMEAIRSFETSVLKRATQRHIPEDGIIQLGYRMDPQGLGVRYLIGPETFLLCMTSITALGPHKPPAEWMAWLFPREESRKDVKQTIKPNRVARLSMLEVHLCSLLVFMAWWLIY
jgi:hypothetical protein